MDWKKWAEAKSLDFKGKEKQRKATKKKNRHLLNETLEGPFGFNSDKRKL